MRHTLQQPTTTNLQLGPGMPFNQSEASTNDYKYATGVNMVRNAIKGMYGWLTNPFGNSKSTINQENNLQSRVK